MEQKSKRAALTLLTSFAVAGCGTAAAAGSTSAPAKAETQTQARTQVPVPTLAQRALAAHTAAATAPECNAILPFYWAIGDASGKLTDAALNTSPPLANAPTADTGMEIASASKLVYGAYVAEKRNGALTPDDVHFLTFVSGYTDFSYCTADQSVADCENFGQNGQYVFRNDGKFYYGGGHMEKHAADNGLGAFQDNALALTVNATLGTTFTYAQPQLAGGIFTTPTAYGNFLQRIVDGQLKIGPLLGTHAVCTKPDSVVCPTSASSPMTSENDHYSIGHWVEDAPLVGDGAFSSAGAFGFYPWIDASKTWGGTVARHVISSTEQEGINSMMCGRKIRAAWVSGNAS